MGGKMSDIEKKKAEVYDLIMQQQELQNKLNAINQIINQKIAEINKEAQK